MTSFLRAETHVAARTRRAAGIATAAVAIALVVAPTMAHAGGFRFRGCVTADDRVGPHGSGACALVPDFAALADLTSLARSPDSRSLYTGNALDCRGLDDFRCTTYATVGRFKLKQKSGALGYRDCTTGARDIRECTPVPTATRNAYRAGLGAVTSIAVSPDGDFVYAVSEGIVCAAGETETVCHGSDALTSFKRNAGTGKLTYQGCITGDERSGPTGSGACAVIPSATADGQQSGLDDLSSVVISPDGTSLYVAAANDDAVARFERDPSTGSLAYRGCITGDTRSGPTGSGSCTAIPTATELGWGSGLDRVSELALSRDGRSLYATASGDSSLAVLARDTATGAVDYRACFSGKSRMRSGACTLLPDRKHARAGLRRAFSVVVSSDDDSVYAGGLGGFAQFARNSPSSALDFVRTYRQGHAPVALRGGGKNLYAALDYGVVRFKRDDRSGRLVRAGCITGAKTHRPRHCRLSPTATRTGEFSGLGFPVSLAVSGRSVYVASNVDSAVARLAVRRHR
jgi:DNA-binding beta-propeller fold protein YncE